MRTKIFFVICACLIAIAVPANEKYSADTLTSQIKKLNEKLSKFEQQIDNKYYTRIPNEDFEDKINVKVEERVNSKFYFWIAIIIGFITLSGAGFYSLINNQIETKVKKLNTEITKYIDESMNKRFEQINDFILEAKKSIFADELEKIQRRNASPQYQNHAEYERAQERLEALLKRANEIKDPELSESIIDELVKCYYLDRKNKEISETIQLYQDKYDLTITTLANAAIAYTDLYELDSSPNYKEMALKYCAEAFRKNPVYGEPTAMELIICMIDHLRAKNDNDKKRAFDDALAIINKVNAGSSYYWANQTIKRLEIDKSSIFAQYVNHLYDLYPEAMKEMQTRADDYDTKKHS
jgi:hypothetical protein